MWKKLVISVMVIGVFSGCVTDKIYNAGKTVYVKGKGVVIKNYDSLDEDTKRKLEAIDELAEKYDETRDKIVDSKDEKQ